MAEILANGRVTLHCGDCLDVMASLPENSVDSIVTDPPYHLTSIVKRFGAEGAAPAFKRLSSGFMQKKWDAPTRAAIEPGFAFWMAGFIDGEGCFSVHKKQVNGYETYDCQFSITLRDDDKDIIIEMRRQLGGIGSIAFRPSLKEGNAKPQVRYCISSQQDCWKLREILTVFPLRAKKVRDFEIWSCALDAWISHEPGTSWENVAYFRDALMAVRKYGADYHPSQLFHYQWALAAYRVLKPGGHLLAFAGTRGYHRMACAIEDGGFEIRDMIAWMYGSGFPKSHDVSKGIDNHLFHEWLKSSPERYMTYTAEIAAACFITDKKEHKKFLKEIDERWRKLGGFWREKVRTKARPETSGTMAGSSDTRPWIEESRELGYHEHDGDTPATVGAKEWKGWGSALKPAMEPICVARKPFKSGIAPNVLQWGTGGLNIDGCRIGTDIIDTTNADPLRFKKFKEQDGCERTVFSKNGKISVGRWPANVIHDGSEEATEGFPDNCGQSGPEVRSCPSRKTSTVYGEYELCKDKEPHDLPGSAARFFYSPKADQDDRLGSKHPTVKPLDLIQYLQRLVTPKGGTTLDMFAGTGTAGEAAFREGFNSILVEREKEYQDDIRRRMALVLGGQDERRYAGIKASGKAQDAGPLFEGLK